MIAYFNIAHTKEKIQHKWRETNNYSTQKIVLIHTKYLWILSELNIKIFEPHFIHKKADGELCVFYIFRKVSADIWLLKYCIYITFYFCSIFHIDSCIVKYALNSIFKNSSELKYSIINTWKNYFIYWFFLHVSFLTFV